MLLPSVDRIVGRMTARVFRQATSVAMDAEPAPDKAGAEWFEDIMRCVDAVCAGDAAAAALILTDTFEKQRTIFEPDVDVVRRELVRAVLGRTTDVKRKLLDRHRDRRALEEHVAFADRSQLASFAGALPGRRRPSLAAFADWLPPEEPKGLGLVSEVVEQTRCRGNLGTEVHLLDAVVAAWRGQREQALASFEAALAAGLADPGSRLACFVALEKRALELGVQLDIQKLLVPWA